MRMSTMKGIAAGSLIGLGIGTSVMMMPQGKKMKRILEKNGSQMIRQLAECWTK